MGGKPTGPASMTGGIAKDRWAEIYLALGDSALSPQKYVELAFTFPEVEAVDVLRFNPGSYVASSLGAIKPGSDTGDLLTYLQAQWGPGRYSLRANIKGSWCRPREFPVGKFDEPAPPAPAVMAATPEAATAELDPKQARAEFLKSLREEGEMTALSKLRADEDQTRLTRQVMLWKMMRDDSTENGGGTSIAIKLLEARNAELREDRARLEARFERLEAKLETQRMQPADPKAASDLVTISQHIQTLGEAAEKLGYTKGAAAPAIDFWAGLAKVGEVLAPTLEKGMILLERVVNAKVTEPGPAAPAITMGGGAAVAQQPIELPPHVKDAIAMTVESLRIRDYDTVLHMLTSVLVKPDGTPFVLLNPKVNPLAYVLQLRSLVPEIDGLRAEFNEFLKWFGDRLEEAKADARAAEAARRASG